MEVPFDLGDDCRVECKQEYYSPSDNKQECTIIEKATNKPVGYFNYEWSSGKQVAELKANRRFFDLFRPADDDETRANVKKAKEFLEVNKREWVTMSLL